MARTTNGTAERTRGGQLLELVDDTHTEIAAKLCVDNSLVTRWISGTRRPTSAQVPRLRELYGIPIEAWSEPATPRTRRKKTARAAAPPSDLPEPPLEDGDEEDEDDGEDNNARLRRFIRDGIRDLEHDTELSGVRRAEALKKLVDAQVSLDKSTGENAITMNRIVAHPDFQRVVRLITEAIAPFPEALRAATLALETVRA